ncbi:acyltransferase family protein [Modestobacter sp. SYSU DS0875]
MAQLHPHRRPEIRALTGLRLLAALWVVAHHLWLFAPGDTWRPLIAPLAPLLDAGWLGVDLFFVLSGFVLAHSHVATLGRRPGVRATLHFYRARLARIWPTWLVVLAGVTVGLLVQRRLVGESPGGASLDAASMLRQVLLVQVWDRADHSATGPVGPGWSLSAEWAAYLVFPLLALGLYRLRRWPAAVLAGLALAAVGPFAALCLVMDGHDWAWSWLVRLTGSFLAGALVALVVAQLRQRPGVGRAAALVAGGAVAVGLVVVGWAPDAGQAGLGVLCFPVLVAALALADRGAVVRLLAGRPAVLGGRVSFALYLVHMAVFETAWTVLELLPGLGPLHVVVPVLPVPVAWALWRWVEEPARRQLLGHRPGGRARQVPLPAPRAAGPGEVVGPRVDAPVTVTH